MGEYKFEIVFRTPKLDSEELRECIEDGLGVEILEINRIFKNVNTRTNT